MVHLPAARTNLTDSTFKFNKYCTVLTGGNVLQRDTFLLLLYLHEYISESVLCHFYLSKECGNLCNL